jgi:acyl carrier protein
MRRGPALRTVDDIQQMLTAILARQLRLAEDTTFTPDTVLDDAGLDSLGMLSFIAAVERDFVVSVSDHDYESLRTFGDALALVERLTR